MLFYIILFVLLSLFIIYPLIVFYFLYKRSVSQEYFKSKYNLKYDSRICAFFHPNCYGGGGGERVLWEAIKVIQKRYSKIFCVVYCNRTDLTDAEILNNVNGTFNIQIESAVCFIRLKYCRFLEANKYPRFTMIGQSLGSIIVGFEALFRCVPHVYFDTVGYAFTLPVFKVLALCRTAAYVHYPTISSDMLTCVSQRTPSFNNNSSISNSRFITAIKVHYYRSFALFYCLVGRTADCVMVNSSWTKDHITSLWGGRVYLVYPPCDVARIEDFQDSTGRCSNRRPWIVSVGQFRAEKNHLLQLQSFKYYLDHCISNLHQSFDDDVRMIMIGGCRNAEDADRIRWLQEKCVEMGLNDRVKFKCDISHKEMQNCFEDGLIAVHTMADEHFGIAIVECMAAGLIMVAHDSAGPKLDIIDNGVNGFLASTCESYGNMYDKILSKPSQHWDSLRTAAKLKSRTFSSQVFALSFSESIKDIVNY